MFSEYKFNKRGNTTRYFSSDLDQAGLFIFYNYDDLCKVARESDAWSYQCLLQS